MNATELNATPPRVFLSAEWRHLLMINYIVDPSILLPFVPNGTEIDEWNGRVYVSVVGFRFLDTKVRGFSIPFHRNFDEVNLRFYVRRKCGDEWRKGVTFIKEIVPRRAIAFVARTLYNENYVRHPMRSSITVPGVVSYEWRRATWEGIAARVGGEPFVPSPESEETFITEHYWGYAQQRDGSTMEYQVEHPPWRVWRCEEATLTCDVATLYGKVFVPFLTNPPASALLAEGSPIIVRYGTKCWSPGFSR